MTVLYEVEKIIQHAKALQSRVDSLEHQLMVKTGECVTAHGARVHLQKRIDALEEQLNAYRQPSSQSA